jgi:predicted nucleotidyltransferase
MKKRKLQVTSYKLQVKKVLEYFSFFAYKPTLDEIYTYLPIKIDKKKLKYTPPQYSMREQISKRKLESWRFKIYIKLLSLAPQIKLIGLSGSISMMNAKEEDDIDLFIITAKNRLFTGRLIALVLAQLLGLRRFRDSITQIFQKVSETEKFAFASSDKHKDKVCLNLFFDESNLRVPKFKQTLFVGHEVLQMKPIVVKDNIYERFLGGNKWVFKLFPNAEKVVSSKYPAFAEATAGKRTLIVKRKKPLNTYYLILNTFFNKIEQSFKDYQLHLINRHRTNELITDSQLWFHPDDFEKKIPE